jgi:hypothetical protein
MVRSIPRSPISVEIKYFFISFGFTHINNYLILKDSNKKAKFQAFFPKVIHILGLKSVQYIGQFLLTLGL